MTIRLHESYGIKSYHHQSNDDDGARYDEVEDEWKVNRMHWFGKKGHEKDVGEWSWHRQHTVLDHNDPISEDEPRYHKVKLYACANGHPSDPDDSAIRHIKTLKIDLRRCEIKKRRNDNGFYLIACFDVGIKWHRDYLTFAVWDTPPDPPIYDDDGYEIPIPDENKWETEYDYEE